ncbi:MAG TPA: hypothetical protein VEO54_24975 [Thermoanaerobaculia bacterium]|nr:hypothetical protein [Thermoanaerobaculia bacterium]
MKNVSRTVLLLVLPLIAFGGCETEPKISAADATGRRVEAVAFKGEAYRTRSGTSSVILVSRDELEYTTNGTTFLCKYSEQGNALRVILTALGTQQVLYFRRVQGGLQSNDGEIYLSETGLAEVERQEELERQRQIQAEAAAEEARAREARAAAEVAAAQARQEEARRIADQPRVEKNLPGSWAIDGATITFKKTANGFDAVAVWKYSNVRESLRGLFLPDGRLEFTPTETVVIDPHFGSQWSYPREMWVVLGADNESLAISRANGSSDSRFKRIP